MTTKRMGDSARASRNFAASLSLYSVGAQVRGLPAKNWTASQPMSTPLPTAFQTPPDELTCAPMYMKPSSLRRTMPSRRRSSDEVPRRLVTPGLREDLPLIPVFALGDAYLVFNEERRRVAGHLPQGDDVETALVAPAQDALHAHADRGGQRVAFPHVVRHRVLLLALPPVGQVVGAHQAAALVMNVVGVAVVGAHERDDRLQGRRPAHRQLEAVEAAPRDARHADRAVGQPDARGEDPRRVPCGHLLAPRSTG